jgi:hypothetical protein
MKPPVDIFMICSIATTESSAEQVMAAAEEIVVITTLKEAKQRYVCVRDARAAAFVIYTQVPAGNPRTVRVVVGTPSYTSCAVVVDVPLRRIYN